MCVIVGACTCVNNIRGEKIGGGTVYKDLRERGYVSTFSFSPPSHSVLSETASSGGFNTSCRKTFTGRKERSKGKGGKNNLLN